MISQIHYFLSLYEELNFTRAAERCGVSQPSLTNGIRSLERQFGGKLFYRTRSSQSRTRPTDLAQALRPHLKQIIDSAGQAQQIAEHLLAKQNGCTQKDVHRHPGAMPPKAVRRANGSRRLAANVVAQRAPYLPVTRATAHVSNGSQADTSAPPKLNLISECGPLGDVNSSREPFPPTCTAQRRC